MLRIPMSDRGDAGHNLDLGKLGGMTMDVRQVAEQFRIEGELEQVVSYGNGHINDTYLLTTSGTKEKRYILQRINTSIFTDPGALMENIIGVTTHLKRKIEAAGGDVWRETLNVIPTMDQKAFYETPNGACYRVYAYVENSSSLEQIEHAEDFYIAAEAFGRFQCLLADYPADMLHETIPGFHNTAKRYRRFLEVVEADVLGRAAKVQQEIDFVKAREAEMGLLQELLDTGELPLRVTHNDTKLNNILLDQDTGRAICVIDLDTVMPGSALYDFGDSIRYGASTAAEDEVDVSRVKLSLELFECYTKGYIKGCQGKLTQREVELLPAGAKMMTLECGMRFLADYLEGDVYFKIHREGHNLDRCRTQLALVADMETKWEEMNEIVKRVAENGA